MDTKQKILEIAYDEFAENGFEKTALSTISDKLGITRPALYYHFPSKEDLFLAVYDTIDPIADANDANAFTASTPEEYRTQLENMIRGIVAHYRSDAKRSQFIAHVQHAASYLPSIVAAADAQDRRLRDALRAVLAKGCALHCFREDFNLDAAVEFLAVTVYGIGEVMLRGSEVELPTLLPLVFDGLFA